MSWVEEVLRRYRLEGAFLEQKALCLWEEVAGERLLRFSRASRVERGVLFVETSSPTVANELTLLKERYLRALNERLGAEALCDLRFFPGKVPLAQEKRRPARVPPRPSSSVAAAAAEVDDPSLRAALERLYARVEEEAAGREEE